MAREESEIEMGYRHVREGEQRVARQREIVAELRSHGHSTAIAEELLAEFEQTVLDLKTHLSLLIDLERIKRAD